MKHCFILNPVAGKGEGADALRARIDAVCREAAVDYEIYFTTGVGDACDYVKRTVDAAPAERYRFYACGGDGTLCEAANGAVKATETNAGASVAIGLIPSGTGNDFVRNFTEKGNFFDIRAQLAGEEIEVDLLRCNDMVAINMVNVGFDCEVVCNTVRFKHAKWLPSGMAYIAGLVVTLIKKPGVRGRKSLDGGEETECRYLLNTYANGCFCGGGFHSNPEGDLQDGKIDALFVRNIGRIRFVSIVGKYKEGTHLAPKYRKIIEHRKLDRLDMIFGKPTNVCVDGEVVVANEIHLSVMPRALRFCIPAGSAPRGGSVTHTDMATV